MAFRASVGLGISKTPTPSMSPAPTFPGREGRGAALTQPGALAGDRERPLENQGHVVGDPAWDLLREKALYEGRGASSHGTAPQAGTAGGLALRAASRDDVTEMTR